MERLVDKEAALRRIARLIHANRAEARGLTKARLSLIASLHDAGYTQDRLADIAQVSQPYIHRVLKRASQARPPADSARSDRSTREQRLDVGRRLRVARERSGLTVAAVARAADLSETDVDTVEGGGEILMGDFLRLVAALGRTDWLSELESLEPTPNERLAAIQAGHPLPMDAGTWSAEELRQR